MQEKQQKTLKNRSAEENARIDMLFSDSEIILQAKSGNKLWFTS